MSNFVFFFVVFKILGFYNRQIILSKSEKYLKEKKSIPAGFTYTNKSHFSFEPQIKQA